MAGQTRVIGRYEVWEELGAGGFATVYRAYDPVLDRALALKVLHPHLGRDTAIRERFIREGRALARVRHPNIVQVYDAGEADGVAYLAMELIEGRSLAVLGEKGGPLRLEDAVAVAEQVGAALAAVHARNLIHRDIKPANIIVEGGVLPGGRAVLLDLGVARALDATAATTTGLLIGTPGFMAPEQVEPDAPVTPLVDVYQLAATLYTLLAGRPPFQGETTRVLYAIVHHPPPDLLALRPDLPPDVVAVITAALAKDPALRPRDPVSFAAQLRQAAGIGTGTAMGNASVWRHVPVYVNQLQTQPTQAQSPPPHWGAVRASPRLRLPWLWLGIGTGVFAASAVAAAVLLSRNGGTASQARAGGTATITIAPPAPATRTVVVTPSPTLPVATLAVVPPATPTRASTPSPTVARSPTGTPEVNVADLLRATMESRGYVPDGEIVRVRATEAGGQLAVQKGVCKNSTSGRCQQLFIFLGQRFLGTDTFNPSQGILDIKAAGTGKFTATYANYAPGDPGCCPSRPPVTITYTWDGSRLTPDGTPPGH